jgi:hypothetical protein
VTEAAAIKMSILAPARIKQICDGVWRDRAAILGVRGLLSGEDALVGAAYWRLCEAGRWPGESIADCAPFFRELVRQYRVEAGGVVESCGG